jgi:hypothetical protein
MTSVAARRGIQTLYRGTLMRSRTEARWAAMFDQLGWRWTYEPFDLVGYIPDFLLHFDAGEMVCEVKSTDEDFRDAERKLDCSTWEGPALIVGQSIDRSVCGRILDWGTGLPEWCDAEFFTCLSCGGVSVLAAEGSWKCRRCGDGHGNAHVGEFDAATAWAEATNRVQWRAA